MDAAAHLGWGAALIAFGAGLASFFSPCVAPLVPGYIGYLSGTAAPLDAPLSATAVAAGGGGSSTATATAVTAPAAVRTRAALVPCLLFVAGFSAAFVLLGLATSSFGRLIVAYRPVLETVAGIVMLAMGAFVLGWLPRGLTLALMRERRLRLPAWMPGPARLGGAGMPVRGLAPFGLGVVFAAGWTPCIGPVLAAILVYVGAEANRGTGALLLAIYSLGFAIPFVAIGLGWATSLRAVGWLRRHGNVVSTVTGVALLIFGVLYLTGEVTVFAVWAQRFTPPGSL